MQKKNKKFDINNFIFEHPDMTSTFDFIVTLNIQDLKELRQKREVKEELQFNNTYKEIVANSDLDYEQNLGNTLKEFLNNFKEIYNSFEKCKENIKSVNALTKISPIELLKQLCADLKNSSNLKYCSPLIENEIYTFIRKDLVSTKRLFEKEDKLKDEVNSYTFYQNESIRFINRFLNNIKDLKELVEVSFVKKKVYSDESATNLSSKFNLKKLNLPSSEFKFNIDATVMIYQYIYKIRNIEDLMSITIYHLKLNNDVFIKCKCCHKFFIPLRNNAEYCEETIWKNNKNENIYCRQKSKENYHQTKEPTYVKEYNNIYKKIHKYLYLNRKDKLKVIKNKEKIEEKFLIFKSDYKRICKFYKTDKDNPKFKEELSKLFKDIDYDYNRLKKVDLGITEIK